MVADARTYGLSHWGFVKALLDNDGVRWDWVPVRDGFAQRGDNRVFIPLVSDAGSCAIALHEYAHTRFHLDEAPEWRNEARCWLASIMMFREAGLPGYGDACWTGSTRLFSHWQAGLDAREVERAELEEWLEANAEWGEVMANQHRRWLGLPEHNCARDACWDARRGQIEPAIL